MSDEIKIYLNIYILLLICFLTLLWFKKYFNIRILSIKFKIPYILFKTGPFEIQKIPKEIVRSINKCSKVLNCKLYYFNDDQCYQLIKNNFPGITLQAYNLLIPTAYKADLWRYCILYLFGGVYGDLSQTFLKKIDTEFIYSDMILVKDRPICNLDTNIQISFIATKPRNNFLRFVIHHISLKILRREKGQCRFDITGPVAFGKLFCLFYRVNKLYPGKNIYLGQDQKKYIINIPFQEIGSFISSINDKDNLIIKTKTENHFKLLNNSYKQHYRYQWKQDLVFKESY